MNVKAIHVSIVEFAWTMSIVLIVPVQVDSVDHFVKLVSSNSMVICSMC